MKRSRRVVLTMMGTAAIGAVSMGFRRVPGCAPAPYRRDGRLPPENCRAVYGGFGTAPRRFHFHGGG